MESFSKWRDGLIMEDKAAWLHPVNRSKRAERMLYSMYLDSKRKSAELMGVGND